MYIYRFIDYDICLLNILKKKKTDCSSFILRMRNWLLWNKRQEKLNISLFSFFLSP